MHVRSVLAAVSVAALFLITPGAGAHEVATGGEISAGFVDREPPIPITIPVLLEDDVDTFEGELSSASAACVRNRFVHVYRLTDSGPELITAARTGTDGTWVAQAEDPPEGRYRAVAWQRTLRSKGHLHRCQEVRSAAVTIGGGGSAAPVPGLPEDPGVPIPPDLPV